MFKKIILYKLLKKHFKFLDSVALFIGIKLEKEMIYLPNLKRKIYLRKNTKDLETFEEIFLTNLYNTQLPFQPKTIVDAGANIGLASLFFKLKYLNSEIIAIEIEKNNIEILKKNTIKLTNFSILHKALFNKKTYMLIGL